MFNQSETNTVAAVASMSAHHGSYTHLCENGGPPFLAHTVVGHELYHYLAAPDVYPED